MTPRWLKIALAISVALNVFALAALATGVIGNALIERRVAEDHKPRRGPPMMEVIDSLDPQVRDRVLASLRAAALTARPDFQRSREARREAIALAGADTFDAPAVTDLMIEAREAEARGRVILETEAVRVLSTLEPQDRERLAPVLSRHGGRMRKRDRQAPTQAE